MAPFLGRLGNGGGTIAGFGFGKRKVPSDARTSRPIIFTMWGAGGGGWIRKSDPAWGPPSGSGGSGGALIATTTIENLGLNSGDQLSIYVGGGGAMSGSGGPNGGHPGGGGGGTSYGGGGGGMTSIYMKGSFSTGTLLLIAGGGSGGFALTNIAGLNADPPPAYVSGTGAGGGSQSSGGSGGGPGFGGAPGGTSGSQFSGGSAGPAAGGGGAGYYGGGGGGGDNGAATGSPGGSGSSYINTTYFTNDTTDSGIANGAVIANIFKRFPAPFNPPMPFSNPTASYPYGPLVYPGPYSQPAGNTASLPFPGQNAGHPLYNASYGGATNSGGNGNPGSVFITIAGTTYSFTSVGPHTLTIP